MKCQLSVPIVHSAWLSKQTYEQSWAQDIPVSCWSGHCRSWYYHWWFLPSWAVSSTCVTLLAGTWPSMLSHNNKPHQCQTGHELYFFSPIMIDKNTWIVACRAGRIIRWSLLYYLMSMLLAVTLGITLVYIIQPGRSSPFTNSAKVGNCGEHANITASLWVRLSRDFVR